MRRSVAIALTLTSFAGAGGCSLLVSTNGLSDGDTATPDGGPGIGDGPAAIDSASEAAAPDAGPDARDAASPCRSKHLFCDDFDTGDSKPIGRWDSLIENAGPIILDTSMFVSPPRALHVTMPPGAGVRASKLRKTLSPTSPKSTLDVDLFVTGPTGGSFVEVDPIGITLSPAPSGFTKHGIAIAIYPTKTVLQYYASPPADGGTTTTVESPFTLPTSRWVHLTITVDYTPAIPLVAIAIDGMPSTRITPGGTAPTSLGLEVGVIYTSAANTDFAVVTDNVVVD